MKNNKISIVIIIILLVFIAILLINKKKSDISYNPQPSPLETSSTTPSISPIISPTTIPTPTPKPIPTPAPTPENDKCKTITKYSCLDYKNGWITAFKLENNLSDNAFNSYISIQSTNFTEQGTNYEFTVSYTIKKSWLTVSRKDSMFIYNADRTHTLIPTEWPLERSSTTNGRTGLSTIRLNDTFAFSSSNNAIDYFTSQYNLSGTNPTIQPSFQYFWNKEGADKNNSPFAGEGGEAFITIYGAINSGQNKCYQGDLALVSKETTYRETPCAIN
jgi:hypothetical protein